MRPLIFLIILFSSKAFAGGSNGGTPSLTRPSLSLQRFELSKRDFKDAVLSSIDLQSLTLGDKTFLPKKIDPLKRQIEVEDQITGDSLILIESQDQ